MHNACSGTVARVEVSRTGLLILAFVHLLTAANRISLVLMSICARNSYRGYRYYGLPNGTPGLAARV